MGAPAPRAAQQVRGGAATLPRARDVGARGSRLAGGESLGGQPRGSRPIAEREDQREAVQPGAVQVAKRGV